MNKKILAGAAALVTAAGMVGGGTFANFHDEEVVPTQALAAGTLNLDMDGSAVSSPMNLVNLKPGDQSANWWDGTGNQPSIPVGQQDELVHVKNTGTLPGSLHVYMTKVSDLENSVEDPEADLGDSGPDGELDANLTLLFDGISVLQVGGQTLGQWLASAAVGDEAEIGIPAAVLGAGAERWFRVSYKIPGTAGNDIQSDSTSFSFRFDLQQ